MLNQFPQLVILYDDLEVVHSVQERAEYLHSVAADDLSQVLIVNKQAQYFTLANTLSEPLSSAQLATRVTNYLLNEGHCCLSKITSLTPQQAFALLEID
jgi:hypothetical protein